MSTLDHNSFKNVLRDNKKAVQEHITQYKAVLQQAEYIYITTDAILNKGGAYLWPLMCDSALLQPASLIIVAPALKVLTSLPAFMEAQGRRGECVTLRMDTDAAWEKPEYFSSFKYSLENKRRGSVIASCFHVMNHASDEWDASGRFPYATNVLWDEITETQAIQQAVFEKHNRFSQIVISQDVDFLRELHTLCNSTPGKSNLITLQLDDAGYLSDPFDTTENDLLTKISNNKLTELSRLTPLYIDDSALKHPKSYEFLNHVKPVLINEEKQLTVLAFKNETLPQSDLLIERAQEIPATIKFSWLDERFDKTNALIAALLAECAQNRWERIAFITDRVARAEKIMTRVAGMGLQVDIYSINKFGFLSCRVASKNRKKANSTLPETKNIDLIEEAIRKDNLGEVQRLASNAEAWEAGVMTCLCQGKINILEALVNQADKVPFRLIRWIITEFRQFQQPPYLMENHKVYEQIVKMLSKTMIFPARIADRLYEHLCEIDDHMTASHVELEYLASLFKDASVNAVGSASPMARIRRAMLTSTPPRSEVNPKLAMEQHQQELAFRKEKIRMEIARLQEELAMLEAEEAAILADYRAYWNSGK